MNRLAVIVGVLALSGCSSTSENPRDTYPIGKVVSKPDEDIVVYAPTEQCPVYIDYWTKPPAGYIKLGVNISATLTGEGPVFVTPATTSLITSSDEYAASALISDCQPPLPSVELQPSGPYSAEGFVTFEIPKAAHGLLLHFAASSGHIDFDLGR